MCDICSFNHDHHIQQRINSIVSSLEAVLLPVYRRERISCLSHRRETWYSGWVHWNERRKFVISFITHLRICNEWVIPLKTVSLICVFLTILGISRFLLRSSRIVSHSVMLSRYRDRSFSKKTYLLSFCFLLFHCLHHRVSLLIPCQDDSARLSEHSSFPPWRMKPLLHPSFCSSLHPSSYLCSWFVLLTVVLWLLFQFRIIILSSRYFFKWIFFFFNSFFFPVKCKKRKRRREWKESLFMSPLRWRDSLLVCVSWYSSVFSFHLFSQSIPSVYKHMHNMNLDINLLSFSRFAPLT